MPPKTPKLAKKPVLKTPKLPKIPKNANIKVYEISFRTLLFPVIFIV